MRRKILFACRNLGLFGGHLRLPILAWRAAYQALWRPPSPIRAFKRAFTPVRYTGQHWEDFMRAETLRALLLVDADAAERRAVSAIAARAGWSVVGAACGETAVGLLQGPHGREVQAALIGNWNPEGGPELIADLRACRDDLPIIVVAEGDSVAVAVEAMRSGATDFLSRPVVQERLLEA